MGDELDLEERRALRLKARAAVITALTELGGEAQRSAVLESARAFGRFTERELEASLPGRAEARFGASVDHALSWALTTLKRDGVAENPQRGVWRLTPLEASVAEEASTEPAVAAVEGEHSIPPPGWSPEAQFSSGEDPARDSRRGLAWLRRVRPG